MIYFIVIGFWKKTKSIIIYVGNIHLFKTFNMKQLLDSELYLNGIEFHNNLNPIFFGYYSFDSLLFLTILVTLFFRYTGCNLSIIYFNILFSLACFTFTAGLSNLTFFSNEFGFKCETISFITIFQHNDVQLQENNIISIGLLFISAVLSHYLFKYAIFIGNELKSGTIIKKIATLFLLLCGQPFYNSILTFNPANILSFVFQCDRTIITIITELKIYKTVNMGLYFLNLLDIIANLCFKRYSSSPNEMLSILDVTWISWNSQCFNLYSFLTLSYKCIVVFFIIYPLISYESKQCKHILLRGERVGKKCNKKVTENGYCAYHRV